MNEKALPNYRKPTNNKYRRKYGSKNKKSPFGHDQNNNSEKKNINDVISYGHTWGEEWIMVSKYLPTKYLLITNREMWLYSGETGQTPPYSSDQS